MLFYPQFYCGQLIRKSHEKQRNPNFHPPQTRTKHYFSLETYTRPDDSKFYTYTFDNITPDTFIDLTLQANFWKFPCCVHVYSKNHNYHCLHFDRFTDSHQFFRGWKLATDDIRMVDESPAPYSWLKEKIPDPHTDADLTKCLKTSRFKDLRPGDEIWTFDNGGWDALAGREGYALVRGGQVVEHFVTRLN